MFNVALYGNINRVFLPAVSTPFGGNRAISNVPAAIQGFSGAYLFHGSGLAGLP